MLHRSKIAVKAAGEQKSTSRSPQPKFVSTLSKRPGFTSSARSHSSSRVSSELAGTININSSFHHNCEVDEGIFAANEQSLCYDETVKVIEFNLPYTRVLGVMSNTKAASTVHSIKTSESISISGSAAYKGSNYQKVFRGSGVPQNISMMRSVTVKSPVPDGMQSLTITLGYLLSRYMFCEDTQHLSVHTSLFENSGDNSEKVTRLSKMLVPDTLYTLEDRASIVTLSNIYNSKVTSGHLRLIQASELTPVSARATMLVYLARASQRRPIWAQTRISSRRLPKLVAKLPYVKASEDLVKSLLHLTNSSFKETSTMQEYMYATTVVMSDRSRQNNAMIWVPSHVRNLHSGGFQNTFYIVGDAQTCPYVSYLALPRTADNTPHVVPYCRHFGCGSCLPLEDLEKSYSNSQKLKYVKVGSLSVLQLSEDSWGGISSGVMSTIAHQCIEGNTYVYTIDIDEHKTTVKQAKTKKGR